MNQNQIEAYKVYKTEYPRYIILFLIDKQYEAYFEDATAISSILGTATQDDTITLPADNVLDYVAAISTEDHPVKIVAARNAGGKREVPDVSGINEERELDY